MPDTPRPCDTHPDLVGFKYPLPHLTQSLKRQRRTRIVAIGSSSTAGEGKIVPYPCRLELALRDRFHGRLIDVLNRGIGGQEAGDELARFEPDVIGEAPAVVIWQVGTNAVFRDGQYNFDDVAGLIATGLEWLAGSDRRGADGPAVHDGDGEQDQIGRGYGVADLSRGRERAYQCLSPLCPDEALVSQWRHPD